MRTKATTFWVVVLWASVVIILPVGDDLELFNSMGSSLSTGSHLGMSCWRLVRRAHFSELTTFGNHRLSVLFMRLILLWELHIDFPSCPAHEVRSIPLCKIFEESKRRVSSAPHHLKNIRFPLSHLLAQWNSTGMVGGKSEFVCAWHQNTMEFYWNE